MPWAVVAAAVSAAADDAAFSRCETSAPPTTSSASLVAGRSGTRVEEFLSPGQGYKILNYSYKVGKLISSGAEFASSSQRNKDIKKD